LNDGFIGIVAKASGIPGLLGQESGDVLVANTPAARTAVYMRRCPGSSTVTVLVEAAVAV
jgi:hypothetical protein